MAGELKLKNMKKNTNLQEVDDMFGVLDGRTPPSDLEIEKKVLGSVIIDNPVLDEIISIIRPENFFKPAHGLIFEAFVKMSEKRMPIDPITLCEQLTKMGKLEEAGGKNYIAEIINSVSSSANTSFHAHLILEKWVNRKVIQVSSKLIENSLDPQVETYENLDQASREILNISESISNKKIISVTDELDKLLIQVQSGERDITGVPTGYTLLDDLTLGFQKSELTLIGGRPSHGKTAFSLCTTRYAIKKDINVAFFSLEMSCRELMLRLVAGESRVNSRSMKAGRLTAAEVQRITDNIPKLRKNLFIDDSSTLTILEIRAKARKLYTELKDQGGLGMVVVDYIQLIKGAGKYERRDLEVADFSKGLKALAKELDIPVVACCQLNRGIETRGKEAYPKLSDLRESGNLEQDADVVMFVHRPSLGQKLNKEDKDYEDFRREAHIIIGKQRNGPTGDVRLVYMEEYTSFETYNPNHPEKRIDTSYKQITPYVEEPF